MAKVSKLTLNNIGWFKSRGYLLGKRNSKDKVYIVHPQDGEKEFDSIWQAQQYVESMIAYRYQTEHPEERY